MGQTLERPNASCDQAVKSTISKTPLAHRGWPIAVTPRAMSPDTVMICSVVSGYPVPTRLAMMGVLRRRLFHCGGHRRRWHVLRRRRCSSLLRRRRWRLLGTRSQADDRQGGDDRNDKRFHKRRSFFVCASHYGSLALVLFTLRLRGCRATVAGCAVLRSAKSQDEPDLLRLNKCLTRSWRGCGENCNRSR